MSSSSPPNLVSEWKVELWIYDLTNGLAAALSPSLLGQKIDGVWHTAIVVFGSEYFYGGGITHSVPGQSMAGQPMRKEILGYTQITPSTFHSFLRGISSRYTPAKYSLLSHNCNNFTDECSKFLVGKGIPSYIVGLPDEVIKTPLGGMILPFIQQMENQMKNNRGGAGAGGGMIPGWDGGGDDAPFLPNVSDNIAPDRRTNITDLNKNNNTTATSTSTLEQKSVGVASTPSSSSSSSSPSPSSSSPSPSSSSSFPSLLLPSNGLFFADPKLSSYFVLLKSSLKKAKDRSPKGELIDSEINDISAFIKSVSAGMGIVSSGGGDSDNKSSVSVSLSTPPPSSTSLPFSLPMCKSMRKIFLYWPEDLLFGPLGILRIAILNQEFAQHFIANEDNEKKEETSSPMGRLLNLIVKSDGTSTSLNYSLSPSILSSSLTVSYNLLSLTLSSSISTSDSLLPLLPLIEKLLSLSSSPPFLSPIHSHSPCIEPYYKVLLNYTLVCKQASESSGNEDNMIQIIEILYKNMQNVYSAWKLSNGNNKGNPSSTLPLNALSSALSLSLLSIYFTIRDFPSGALIMNALEMESEMIKEIERGGGGVASYGVKVEGTGGGKFGVGELAAEIRKLLDLHQRQAEE